MHKLVLISTHGVSVIEGTPIHCFAALGSASGNYSYAFMYDGTGKLINAKKAEIYNPIDNFFLEGEKE